MNTTNHQQTLIKTNNNKTFKETDSKLYQDYYERKRIAMVMEENNNSKIIVIPSLANKGKKDEWLKIAGNSAFFYKYLIAPRLHKKPPTIHPDTDLNYRFKSGIIAIHWKDSFINNMATLGFKPCLESNLIIFDLHHNYTPSEIKKLHALENAAKNKANQLLKPKTTIPEIYQLLLKFSQILPNKIRKMNEFYRESFGKQLTNTLIELLNCYINLSDGSIDQSTAREKFLKNINYLNAILIILNENHALDYSTSERLGTLLIDVKNSITRKLNN